MTEKKLQAALVAFLKHHQIYYLKTIVCSRAGVPDFIACINGRFISIELKGSKGKESALQKYNGEKIRKSGGEYFVLTPENYCEITDKIMESKR